MTKQVEFLILSLLKKVVSDALDDLGFEPVTYNLDSLLSSVQIRNMVIRQEYLEQKKSMKVESLYSLLANKHGLSYGTVREIIHHRR